MGSHRQVKFSFQISVTLSKIKSNLQCIEETRLIEERRAMKHALRITQADVQYNTDKSKHVRFLEHVKVKVTIEHPRRGDLEIKLTSPMGTVSVLLERRMFDRSNKVDFCFRMASGKMETTL